MRNFIQVLGITVIATTVMAQDPAASQSTEVKSFNKASAVIGMAVKDPNGKQLAKVQELVIDLAAKKVGYAVLAMNNQDGIRLVPVPISALKPGKDHLVLNMTPAVLAAATGIANDEWPAPDSFAVGGPAGAETGSASSTGK